MSKNLFAVILAGGSGTRFWPASRRLLPKQLLPLGPSAPQSLIVSTVERLKGLIAEENILVATGAHLLDATQAELGLSASAFLAEPQAKNTAPCIAWAAHAVKKRDPNAVVCVLPSDQHAMDEAAFVHALAQASEAAAEGAICTIGIIPTRPETGYGYIEKGDAAQDGASFQVARFVEKPDRATAEEYLASGRYLWNAGIFVFRAQDMIDALERHAPELNRGLAAFDAAATAEESEAAIEKFFAEAPSISIDYAVMEKEQGLRVVPAEFGWSDLGSWESAWELSEKDAAGNALSGLEKDEVQLVDASRNLVCDLRKAQGEKRGEKVIALVGVDDLIVVETDDALLVMPRERSQDVRVVVDALKQAKKTTLV